MKWMNGRERKKIRKNIPQYKLLIFFNLFIQFAYDLFARIKCSQIVSNLIDLANNNKSHPNMYSLAFLVTSGLFSDWSQKE